MLDLRIREYKAGNMSSNIHEKIIENANKLHRHHSVFIMQLYSMRSHKTNQYNPWADGNFNHTLHELYDLALAKNPWIDAVYIAYPTNIQDEFLVEKLYTVFNKIEELGHIRVGIIPTEYGINVVDTRKRAKELFSKFASDVFIKSFDIKQCVCDFEEFEPIPNVCMTYRFNVTTEFTNIEKQIELSKQYPVSVFNDYQLGILKSENVFVSEHWFNKDLVRFIANHLGTPSITEFCSNVMFIPFRLSDTDYHIPEILEFATNNEWAILVTDPNEDKSVLDGYKYTQVSSKKEDIYKLCLDNANNDKFMIMYLSDPTKVLHQSFLEFMTLCPNCIATKYTRKENIEIANRYMYDGK